MTRALASPWDEQEVVHFAATAAYVSIERYMCAWLSVCVQ